MSSLTASSMDVTCFCYCSTHTHTEKSALFSQFYISCLQSSILPFFHSFTRGNQRTVYFHYLPMDDGTLQHICWHLANYELINKHINLHMDVFNTLMLYYIHIYIQYVCNKNIWRFIRIEGFFCLNCFRPNDENSNFPFLEDLSS